jgi:hypothetical protein
MATAKKKPVENKTKEEKRKQRFELAKLLHPGLK